MSTRLLGSKGLDLLGRLTDAVMNDAQKKTVLGWVQPAVLPVRPDAFFYGGVPFSQRDPVQILASLQRPHFA